MRAVMLCLLFVNVFADVYMHNPRGSNDRNCERNVNRKNGNRLFDSQNNAKGGYACPRAVGGPEIKENNMYYYAGSTLAVQWTNQHGCGGNSNVNCEIVLQYMCEDSNPMLRDGTPQNARDDATKTIPDNPSQVSQSKYGYHEPIEWYAKCKARSRNRGLFTADRRLRKSDARSTRQNNNGNRRGLECPEERDYYPYWTPTPWKDIAVLVDDPTRCKYYQDNSNNVKKYGECVAAATADLETGEAVGSSRRRRAKAGNVLPITKDACEQGGKQWVEKSWDLPPPECKKAEWSRDNHLGNGIGGWDSSYNWTVPDVQHSKCVLRLRYNISTADYPGLVGSTAKTGSSAYFSYINNAVRGQSKVVNNNSSMQAKIRQDVLYELPIPAATETEDLQVPTKGTWLLRSMMYGVNLETDDADADTAITASVVRLEMAANTNQYGRTFQDRSYVFGIRPRPSDIPASAKIQNLGVTGKRGNIVQTYPAHEYDFAPKHLAVNVGDYVHFQWEGSDYNPRRGPNNAEGGPPDRADNNANKNARADRSNIVETDILGQNIPSYRSGADMSKSMFPDEATAFKMAFIKQDLNKCKSPEQLAAIKGRRRQENDVGNCQKLNAADHPYFDGGLVPMTKPGRFTYMSTRNNNFSNRSQKGFIAVGPAALKETPEHAGMVDKDRPLSALAEYEGGALPVPKPPASPSQRKGRRRY